MANFTKLPNGYFIGPHVRKFPTLLATVQNVIQRGNLTAFQIFLRSSHSYALGIDFSPEYQNDLIQASESLEKHGLKCVIHSAYLYNLCGSVNGPESIKAQQNLKRSINGLRNELDLAVALGNEKYTPPVVVHMGSCKYKEKGIKTAISALNEIGRTVSSLTEKVAILKGITVEEVQNRRRLCLENCAGEGTKLWVNIEDIEKIYLSPELDPKIRDNNLGFCIDTAHFYGSGEWNFGEVSQIEAFISRWKNSTIPFSKIQVIHLNDSEAIFKSKKDKHAELGYGLIYSTLFGGPEDGTVKALLKLLNIGGPKGELSGIPFILESPGDSRGEMQYLWSILSPSNGTTHQPDSEIQDTEKLEQQ